MKLRIKSLKGYADSDQVLLHAAFTCLECFVRREWGGRIPQHIKVDLDDPPDVQLADARQDAENREVMRLYHWWRRRKKDNVYPPDSEQWDEDTVMLIRLIKVRGALWT